MLVIWLVHWSLWSASFLGGDDVKNSCMFTCIMSHSIGLQVGCSGTVVEPLSYGVRRIPMLSCRWWFGLCRDGHICSSAACIFELTGRINMNFGVRWYILKLSSEMVMYTIKI